MTSRLSAYLVSARTYDSRPVRLEIMARSNADALITAQELFPQHLISAVHLIPEWSDAS